MCRFTKSIAVLGFAAAITGSLALGAAAPASAQGFYFNAPGIHIGVGHPYHHYYGRPYGYRYYDYYGGGGGNCYYGGCCPPGMTIQGGACRPYRGY